MKCSRPSFYTSVDLQGAGPAVTIFRLELNGMGALSVQRVSPALLHTLRISIGRKLPLHQR